MAVHYSLPERRKHHEEIVRRLISNPESRNNANTYIYRQNHEDRERIVNILNQWDNEGYSTSPSSQVINKQAVPNIKDWCSSSSGKDLVSVKKFLQHLTKEQEASQNADEETSRQGTASSRRPHTQQTITNRPGLTKRETITNGSFYPDPFEGRGNSTGMFNIVRTVPQPILKKRPTTSGSVAPQERKPSGIQRNATQPVMKKRTSGYSELPTNRSGVFGEIIRPFPQVEKENQRPPTMSKENTTQKRPPSNHPNTRGQWSRPGTMQSGRSHSKIPVSAMQRSRTHSNMIHRRQSDDKMKFSANMQNTRDEDAQMQQQQQSQQQQQQQPAMRTSPQPDDGVTPRQHHSQRMRYEAESYEIDVNRTSSSSDNQAEYYSAGNNDGDTSHRPIDYQNKFPTRRYQASQIFF